MIIKSIGFLGFLALLNISSNPSHMENEPYQELISGSEESISMVFIEKGNFEMGSPEKETGRSIDEGPQKEVGIDAFWMSTLEITWDQYQLFLYREIDDAETTDKGEIEIQLDAVSGATMPYVNFNKPGYPVINITHYAASTFCQWLTAKTGRYYRLPTEAEWEYACRAGLNSPYAFEGKDLNKFAWYAENSSGQYQKGGLKEPNTNGLYDMHGNVAEWVVDAYEEKSYSNSSNDNPVVFSEELYPKVARGGSWKSDAAQIRSASRDYSRPDWKKRDPQFPKSLWWLTDAPHVGFRIVRPKVVPSSEEMSRFQGKAIEEY